MGLISHAGENLLMFSSCGRCSRLTTGTSGTRSGGLRKRHSPCELLGGLSGFLSRRCRGLRPCVETVPEPEDSSPVLTWILGYFWSLPRGHGCVTVTLVSLNHFAISNLANLRVRYSISKDTYVFVYIYSLNINT